MNPEKLDKSIESWEAWISSKLLFLQKEWFVFLFFGALLVLLYVPYYWNKFYGGN